MKFDVMKLTVQQLIDYNRHYADGNVDEVSKVLAQVCQECPEAWGKPDDPETFAGLIYSDYAEAVEACGQATQAASKAVTAGEFEITCNLREIKARDFGKRFIQPSNRGDSITMAKFMSEVITKCPKDWGKSNDPETYLNLPYYAVFVPLSHQLTAGARNPKK
jgi:hypothetical protein